MKKRVIYSMKSPFRGEFRITGYEFGEGEKSVAIIGAMRGDEVQQQYVCAKLVGRLEAMEKEGKIGEGKRILVIPSANPFSMNLEKRFWAMDNTDINRMFPGYEKGETTQRIAAAVFEELKEYTYGIQLASFYTPGEFVAHVRMMDTGYQDTADAKEFELPYVYVRKPRPYDSTMLNYNWQIWGSFAFSIYAGQTNAIDTRIAEKTISAILRFLNGKGIISAPQRRGYVSDVIKDEDHIVVRAKKAGLYVKMAKANQDVKRGDVMGRVIDPYNGSVVEEVLSPCDGVVFFAHRKAVVLENTVVFRVIRNRE